MQLHVHVHKHIIYNMQIYLYIYTCTVAIVVMYISLQVTIFKNSHSTCIKRYIPEQVHGRTHQIHRNDPGDSVFVVISAEASVEGVGEAEEATSESGIVNGVPFSVTAVTAVGVNPCDTIHCFSVEDA